MFFESKMKSVFKRKRAFLIRMTKHKKTKANSVAFSPQMNYPVQATVVAGEVSVSFLRL
jgi:hypothetical protein